MAARAKEPLHMTYRAVGSSTGMLEFVGPSYSFTAQADFGAGDIPMSQSRFDELTANGRQMLHVPVAIGAIAVFHSIPEAELGGEPLSLDACLIARIYAGDITTWDHPAIQAENPALTATAPIKVAHRLDGSSSTSGFTTYLSEKCPTDWTLGGESSFDNWPVGTGFEGSGGMSGYLEAEPYAIAYIDSGHGIAEGLAEIALQNKDDFFLKSSEADVGAAAVLAINNGTFPTDPTASFAKVSLFDLPGPKTWPITMVTYIYLEKDQTAKDPETAGLLEAFVRFVLSEEGQALAVENLFVAMPQELIDLGLAALGLIEVPPNMVRFTRETSTDAEDGLQDYVLSDKRQSFADYERKELIEQMDEMRAAQASLVATVSAIGSQSTFEVHGSGTTNPSVRSASGQRLAPAPQQCCCRVSIPLPPTPLTPPLLLASSCFPCSPLMQPSRSLAALVLGSLRHSRGARQGAAPHDVPRRRLQHRHARVRRPKQRLHRASRLWRRRHPDVPVPVRRAERQRPRDAARARRHRRHRALPLHPRGCARRRAARAGRLPDCSHLLWRDQKLGPPRHPIHQPEADGHLAYLRRPPRGGFVLHLRLHHLPDADL
jgi:ABC-type phosphate transport system substrate-binding protein